MKTKKAAMFGLDARIALAIFGALSIIIGASLYSAIQNARVTAIYEDMNELGKASEAYWLDTGSRLEANEPEVWRIKSQLLNSNLNNDPNWKGPYTGHTSVSETMMEYSKLGLDFALFIMRRKNIWTNDLALWPNNCGAVTARCYEWIRLQSAEKDLDSKLFNRLDEKYDNSDGPHEGTIRYRDIFSYAHLYFRTVLRGAGDV